MKQRLARHQGKLIALIAVLVVAGLAAPFVVGPRTLRTGQPFPDAERALSRAGASGDISKFISIFRYGGNVSEGRVADGSKWYQLPDGRTVEVFCEKDPVTDRRYVCELRVYDDLDALKRHRSVSVESLELPWSARCFVPMAWR